MYFSLLCVTNYDREESNGEPNRNLLKAFNIEHDIRSCCPNPALIIILIELGSEEITRNLNIARRPPANELIKVVSKPSPIRYPLPFKKQPDLLIKASEKTKPTNLPPTNLSLFGPKIKF